jgi:hypothetical protein
MLEKWDTSEPNSFWQGRWFFGYTAMETTVPPVWVRCQGAVSFGFTAEEWASLQEAFRRAWEMPQLSRDVSHAPAIQQAPVSHSIGQAAEQRPAHEHEISRGFGFGM